MMGTGWDDEELLAALRQALLARQAVPPGFVEAAQNAFAWRNIDAELAELTYDSVRDNEMAASMRAEAASIRALTFTSAHLTIELEVRPGIAARPDRARRRPRPSQSSPGPAPRR